VSTAHVEAARAVGHHTPGDLNGAELLGAACPDLLICDGRRQSTATAYLRPAASRTNLAIRTGTCASQLIVRDGRCCGVEYIMGGQRLSASAAEEVVLCAGTVGSTQLLLVSGIGPADELAAVGVAPLVDSPGVGRNLQDHILLAGRAYQILSIEKGAPMAVRSRTLPNGTLETASREAGDPAMDLLNTRQDSSASRRL